MQGFGDDQVARLHLCDEFFDRGASRTNELEPCHLADGLEVRATVGEMVRDVTYLQGSGGGRNVLERGMHDQRGPVHQRLFGAPPALAGKRTAYKVEFKPLVNQVRPRKFVSATAEDMNRLGGGGEGLGILFNSDAHRADAHDGVVITNFIEIGQQLMPQDLVEAIPEIPVFQLDRDYFHRFGAVLVLLDAEGSVLISLILGV